MYRCEEVNPEQTRAWRRIKADLYRMFMNDFDPASWPKLKNIPSPGYCMDCGAWAWLTNNVFPYSTADRYYLCNECEEVNDEEWSRAWDDYYSSRL